MCDLFWLPATMPSAEQGDLSDVVRESLQSGCQPPLTEELPTTGFAGDEAFSDLDLQEELQVVHDEMLKAGAGDEQRSGSCSDADAFSSLHLLHISTPGPADVMSHIDHRLAAAHVPGAIKRRKSQAKKVVCIPAPTAAGGGGSGRGSTSGGGGEVVPSDLWAWRKYGQKPIKGSPYPRGYYRCSSSKGCSARKQVERSRTDPNMLVITYTSEHNHPWPTHRNALAGSTRPSTSSSHHRCYPSAANAITSQPRHQPPSSAAVPVAPHHHLPITTTAPPNHHHVHSIPHVSCSSGGSPGPDAAAHYHHQHQQQPPPPKEEQEIEDVNVESLLFAGLEEDGLLFSNSKAAPPPLHHSNLLGLGDKPFDPFTFFDWPDTTFGEPPINKGL